MLATNDGTGAEVFWIEADTHTWYCQVKTGHGVVEQRGELWVPRVTRDGQVEEHAGFFFRSSAMSWAEKQLAAPPSKEAHPTILLNETARAPVSKPRPQHGAMNSRTTPHARARRRCLLLNQVAYRALGAPTSVTLHYLSASGRIRVVPCGSDVRGALLLQPPQLGETCRVDVGSFWQMHGISTTRPVRFVITVDRHVLELAPMEQA